MAEPSLEGLRQAAEDYRRLREVKADYGPDNVFRVNHNILPA